MASVIIVGSGFLPLPSATQHGITDQTGIVSRDTYEGQVRRVHLLGLLVQGFFLGGYRRLLLLLLLQEIGVTRHH